MINQWVQRIFALFMTAPLSTAWSTHTNCPLNFFAFRMYVGQVLPNFPRLIRPIPSKPVSLTSIFLSIPHQSQPRIPNPPTNPGLIIDLWRRSHAPPLCDCFTGDRFQYGFQLNFSKWDGAKCGPVRTLAVAAE